MIAGCPTRWGHVHKVVICILEQITAIHVVLSADHKCSHLLPTWQDTKVLEAIDTVLSPLADMTNLLSRKNMLVSTVTKHIHMDALAKKDDNISLAKDKTTYSHRCGLKIFGY